jgi:hypothetical protein
MTQVLIANGHDNTASLSAFSIEPLVPMIMPGIRRLTISKKAYEDGDKTIPFRWGPKVDNDTVDDARTKAGLTSGTLYNEVTIYVPTNEDRTTGSYYNATAYAPDESEYNGGGWDGFEILMLWAEEL